MNKHTYKNLHNHLSPSSIVVGAGNRGKARFVRVHVRKTAMRMNAYVSIALLSQSDAGIFFSMRTHTIVHGTSRWLTNRVEAFCRFALSFDVLFAIVAFKTLMLKAVDLFAADSLIIKKK